MKLFVFEYNLSIALYRKLIALYTPPITNKSQQKNNGKVTKTLCWIIKEPTNGGVKSSGEVVVHVALKPNTTS